MLIGAAPLFTFVGGEGDAIELACLKNIDKKMAAIYSGL